MKTNAIPFSIELFETGDYDVCYRGRTEPLEELSYVKAIPSETHVNFRDRVISVDKEGYLRTHTSDGLFDPEAGQTCLDLLLVPKKVQRKLRGTALMNDLGNPVGFRFDDADPIASITRVTPVPCTITLDDPF